MSQKLTMLAMMAVIGVALAYEHDTQHPSHGHGHGYPQHGGHSNTFRKQDDHGNYAFGYEIKDPKGAQNYRKESGDAHGNVHGSYGLQDIDGRWRVVNYVADKVHGFRAKIETNEPGTGNADTAAVIINGADQHGGSKTSVAAGHHAPNYNDGGHQDGPAYKKAASA